MQINKNNKDERQEKLWKEIMLKNETLIKLVGCKKKQNLTAGLIMSLVKTIKHSPTGSGAKQVTPINWCTNRAHLLCRGSRCEEVRKALSELHFIFQEVMMVGLLRWGEADLLKERHGIHKQVHAAPETCGRRSL